MKRAYAIVLSVVCGVAVAGEPARGKHTLSDYRYFRALSIDLVGRPPTRAELTEFDGPDFDLDRWIDAHLTGDLYASRLTRIYMDLLKLELPPTVIFRPADIELRWAHVLDSTGAPVYVYYRLGQRRVDPMIDGQLCFTEDESGIKAGEGAQTGTPKPISKALLDARTVVVKPWWLYADYRSPNPKDYYSPEWIKRFGYDLEMRLFVQPDKTPMTGIRVCREEAQTATVGKIFTTGRTTVVRGQPPPPGRSSRMPLDTPYATSHVGKQVSCMSRTGFESSAECGCGVGLERCLPAAPAGFVTPMDVPLGVEEPFTQSPRPAHLWLLAWLGQEAVHYLDHIFTEDRDFRELLTSRGTVINGPLAQFYRFFANATCCGAGTELGYAEGEPLFAPDSVPSSIPIQDAGKWYPVADRGPHASGLLTMPVFLLKYGTRRQRAHAIYSAFLCKDFVANSVKLEPSTEPDLTKRPGCSACHVRLEPLAAYFTRIQENDWTYLPPSLFPVSSSQCAGDPKKRLPPGCKNFYDPAFTDASHATLRGAYASPTHADVGVEGLAAEITSSPDFAPCVVQNVAQAFLGRQLTTDDETWKLALAKQFAAGGYRVRSLVRAIVTSDRYRETNDQQPEAR